MEKKRRKNPENAPARCRFEMIHSGLLRESERENSGGWPKHSAGEPYSNLHSPCIVKKTAKCGAVALCSHSRGQHKGRVVGRLRLDARAHLLKTHVLHTHSRALALARLQSHQITCRVS